MGMRASRQASFGATCSTTSNHLIVNGLVSRPVQTPFNAHDIGEALAQSTASETAAGLRSRLQSPEMATNSSQTDESHAETFQCKVSGEAGIARNSTRAERGDGKMRDEGSRCSKAVGEGLKGKPTGGVQAMEGG